MNLSGENVSELRSFFISNQFCRAENLKPLSVLNIASKTETEKKKMLVVHFFLLQNWFFACLNLLFYISFKLLGHKNPNSLIALGLEELEDIKVYLTL